LKLQVQAVLFALRHIGLLGWVGIALALSSLAYAAVIVPQQRAELIRAAGETARLQQRRLALVREQGTAPDTAAQAQSAAELPTVKTTPEALLQLDEIARKDRLRLSRNDYRYVASVPPTTAKDAAPAANPEPVVEVRVAMPSIGRYGDIRAFIAHALEHLPTLALDGIVLNRESIAQGDIQAQLRFTLFVRGGT
jgi:hypothetical protein